MTFLIALCIDTLLVALLAFLTFLFFHYFRKLDARSIQDSELPFVSVIVPARNEGGKIGRCLESLAKQDYPKYEVIAVNDRSEDNTGTIIENLASQYPQIRGIQGKDAPPGWIGKCNALVQAVNKTSEKAQWFLFTDADTFHNPNSLRYALSYAVENNAELISFMPVQEMGSFWERVVMPVLLGSFLCGDPLNTINEHTNERAYAYGQYILVRRDIYEEVGGHASVHDQILDDISFARLVKSFGHHILSADGRLLYRVRMYTNLENLWQGWTKNLYALIECRVPFLFIVLALLNAAILGPFISFVSFTYSMVQGTLEYNPALYVGLITLQMILLFSWYKRTARHYLGLSWWHFLLLPLGSITVSVLYLHSAYLVHSGHKVSWKGRRYTVNTSKSIENDKTDKEDNFIEDKTDKVCVGSEN